MTRTTWGFLYWGGVWLLVGFLAAELTGFFRVAPWPTLSETVWASERYPLVASGVFALLLGLMAHFLYRRPLWQSLLFGVLVAAAAHIVDARWP